MSNIQRPDYIEKEIIETKNVTESYAILETKVDFKNLEYLLVIKNYGFCLLNVK